MRIYSAEHVEALEALDYLHAWETDGLLSKPQAEQLMDDTTTDLHTTNLFLRVALFFFTLVIVSCITGLFFLAMSGVKDFTIPVLLLAVCWYAAAEFAVKEYCLYRFGIEEALVLCFIGYLCVGLQVRHDHVHYGSDMLESLIMLVCACASLWIWHRFGYWYAFVAAMLFVAFMPHCLTNSPAAQHALLALMYAAGLMGVLVVGARHRFDSLRSSYSVAESLLWAGTYLSMNLVLSVLDANWLHGLVPPKSAFPSLFYWFTWVFLWCLPPAVLVRGMRGRERSVLITGAGLCILTLVSNKPYLGWQRHPWDPMLLGVVLAGGAWWLQRWLAQGTDGVRNGFTAERLTGRRRDWLGEAPSVVSLVVPHTFGQGHGHGPEQPLGQGGRSGGAGAGGEY